MIETLIPPPEARALIFDCDGTLAMTRHAHFEALRWAFHAQGFVLTEEWYLDHTGLSLNETCEALAAKHGMACDAGAVRKAHVARYPDLLARVCPVTEIVDIARGYHGRLPLAVASGGDQLIVEMTLEHIGVRALFDQVVAIGAIRRGKPAPDLFLAAAERMGIEAEACHVYEDSDEGLEAAHRAGMSAFDVRDVPGLLR